MKQRIAIVCVIFLLLSFLPGCKPNEETIVADFNKMTEGMVDSTKIVDASSYLQENIKRVSEDTGTGMLIRYEAYLDRYIKENPEKGFLTQLVLFYDKETKTFNEEKIKNSELKAYLEAIEAGGLKIAEYEGSLVLRIDYGKLLEQYGSYVSEAIVELYRLTETVTNEPITEDATLKLSYEALLERALEAETILKNYPGDETVKADAMWIYTSHLNALLMGATNSPIFDYKTQAFSSQAMDAHISFMQKYPDTILTWVLKEYYTYLTSTSFTLDYSDKTASKVFFETCDWVVSEAEKRVQK
jgi:hypothetical protein